MSDELHQFLNRIRILHCVDGHEIADALGAAGLELTAENWRKFRAHPAEFMVQADDPTQRVLWSIIERRERRSQMPELKPIVATVRKLDPVCWADLPADCEPSS